MKEKEKRPNVDRTARPAQPQEERKDPQTQQQPRM